MGYKQIAQGVNEGVEDSIKETFKGQLLDVLGDPRLLYLFDASGTTITDKSRHARVATWSKEVSDFDDKPFTQGWGIGVHLDGTDEEADIPDAANLSFGDGAVDEAFSVVALIKPDVNNATFTILSKLNSASVDEWEVWMDGNGYPVLELIDASSSASISRYDATAFGTDEGLLVTTYDGSRAVTGINIYKDGVLIDDSDNSAGTYTAMEDTASLVRIGMRYATAERFFNGKMYLLALTAKELTIDEIWTLKELVNGYFDLSL